MKRKGNVLTITVDLSKEGTPSATGKTLLIATSKGNAPVPPEASDNGLIFVGLNVFKKEIKK